MPNSARFVSVSRFARFVGLSERTCWNLIRSSELPVVRIGRRTLIKVPDGLAAIEKIGADSRLAKTRP